MIGGGANGRGPIAPGVRIVRGGDGDERDAVIADVVARALAMLSAVPGAPDPTPAWWRAGLVTAAIGRRPRSPSDLATEWSRLAGRRG